MDLVDLLCAKNIVEKLNLKYKIKCQSIREITFKKINNEIILNHDTGMNHIKIQTLPHECQLKRDLVT